MYDKTKSTGMRQMYAKQSVYGMIPQDGSEIQMKELKKEVAKISMSTATLSAHLKSLAQFGFIRRRVDDKTYPPSTFYSRLPPIKSAAKSAEKIRLSEEMTDEVFKMIVREKNNSPELFEAVIDANISSISAVLTGLIDTCRANFTSSDLEKSLGPYDAMVDVLGANIQKSHNLLDMQIDLIIRPWLYKFMNVVMATALPDAVALRQIYFNKFKKLLAEALKDVEKSEKILNEYKKSNP